jgi:hypothetical protein
MKTFDCLTTGIGSLPLKEASEALRIIFNSIDIPFWPQLPKRDFREQMIPQFSEGMPCLRLDEEKERMWVDVSKERADEVYKFYKTFLEGNPYKFQISKEYSIGFHEFLKELTRLKTYKYIKGQVTGPITFSLGLAGQDRRPIYYDDEMRDIATKLISMKALYQIKELDGFGAKVIIFIDEPILSAIGSSTYLGIERGDIEKAINEVIDVIHSAGALAGIHCCGNTDWSVVTSTRIDILSFDAYHFFNSLTLYPEEIKGFIDRGGNLAWGIIPTGEDILHETVRALIERLRDDFGVLKSLSIEDDTLKGQCLITPSCGTGSMEIDQAKRVFELLNGVVKGLR